MAHRISETDLRVKWLLEGQEGVEKAFKKQEEDIAKWTKQVAAAKDALAKLAKEGKEETKEYENQTKVLNQNKAALEKSKQGLESLYRQQKLTTMNMAELRRHIKVTNNELKHTDPGNDRWKALSRELKATKDRLKELSDQSDATKGALGRLSKIRVGTIAAIHSVSSAVRGVSKAIGTIADFEQANANLATIIGKPASAIEKLTHSARELGGTTEYTASQVTQLQTELAKLGFKEKDIMNMQESVLHFATAVGADLSEAASLAGATLRMFGLETSQTEDTLGVLTKATTNSALSFSYLQTAMSIVGPVAKTFGFSVRDTTALLGTLANSGFDASSAATATRNILLKLADANGKLATALGGPVKTLPELVEGLKTLDAQGVDLVTTLELTDKRSVSAFNSFLHGADDVDTLRESLEDVKGVLGDTAEARMNTVNGSIKLLKSAWEEFILSLSNSKGVIKSTIDLLTDFVHKITPKQKDKQKLGDAQSQGEGLMASYWNSAVTEEAREEILTDINRQIDEARKVLEGREKGFANVVGRRQRKQAEKGLAEARHNVEMLEAAREDYLNRVKWEAGTYYDASGSNNNSGSNNQTDDDNNNKKSSYDPAKESEKILAELNKEWEEYYKKQEELEKEGADIMIAAEESKTAAAYLNELKRYKEEVRKFRDTEVEYENKTEVIEAIEKKHQINLAKIRQEAFDRDTALLETKHNIEKEKIRKRYLEELAERKGNGWQSSAINQAMQEELARADIQYLKSLASRLKQITDSGKINGATISDEDKKKYELKLAQTINKINELTAQDKANSSGVWGGTGGGSLFGVSEAQWGQFFYNLEHSKLKADDLANAMTAIGNLANEGFQLASKAIANTNAKEQAAFKEYQKIQENEKKALKNRLDSGLVSQAQYDAEVERMNAEAEAKQEAMKLKQAKREKSLNIIQSIINTALGVTKTLAQWGIPAGIAPAAIMSAMGAAQTALIAAQPVTGAEAGGYVNTRRAQDGKRFKARLSPDKRGFISSPTVLVGENGGEYVIPAAGLDNPTLRPMLATIETARQAGRLKDLNFEAIYPLSSPIGRESGGYVQSPPHTSTPNVATAANGTLETLAEAISVLNDRLSKPIKADVSMTGRNGIIEKTEEYNRAKKRGQYNG